MLKRFWAIQFAVLGIVCAVFFVSCGTMEHGGHSRPRSSEPNSRHDRELSGDFGYVTVAQSRYSAELMGERGVRRLKDAARPGLPAGQYYLLRCTIEAEEDGRVSRITGQGQGGQAPLLIKPNEESELIFGAPLIAEVSAHRLSFAGGFGGSYFGGGVPLLGKEEMPVYVRLSLSITGQGGEVYSPRSFQQFNRSGASAPRFKVLGKDGAIVGQGQFEYG